MADVRLIDANAALALIKQLRNKDINNHTRQYACNFAMSILGNPEQTPTINPEDYRPHGRWEYDSYGGGTIPGTDAPLSYKCLVCGEYDVEEKNFCPHCGAKMDGKEQDNE